MIALPSGAARMRLVLAVLLLGVSVGVAGRSTDVRLVGPVEQVSAAGLTPMQASRIADLAGIDPEHPSADGSTEQVLSLFGREDLIAATSADYRPVRCAPLGTAAVFGEIERRARRTSIVIVTESHRRSEHRGFTAEVARRLRSIGYDTLALEALSPSLPGTPERYLPTFVRQPTLPYLEDDDGHYLAEAGFGRLGRRAKALGYLLLAYEAIDEHPAAGATREQQIAVREEGQANNLAAYLRGHPGAKLLIHAGYSHAAEVPRADGSRWMAARLKEKTGIDPLTVSQTTCRGGGDADRLVALPADQPAGTFDLVVDHPTARFEHGRPAWRAREGDRPVAIPRPLYPARGWRVVEARPVDESSRSVPMDRVAIRAGDDVALMLPPGRYRLRVVDVARAATPAPPAG